MVGRAQRLVDQQASTDATLREIVNVDRRRASAAAWKVSLNRIRDARRRNDFDAGDRLLEEALAAANLDLRSDIDPDALRDARERRASASRALAEVRLEQFDFQGAASLYRDAIETFPETASVERWGCARAAGSALRRTASLLGRVEAASLAVDILRDAVSAAPDEADRHNELGLACIVAGELASSPESFEEAQTAYSAALSATANLPPEQAEAFRLRVRINRTVALRNLALIGEECGAERQTEAEGLLRQAIRELSGQPGPMAHVDLPRAWDNLGTLLFDQGKWDDAIAAFETASHSWDDADERARTLSNLGLSYAHAHRFEDALTALDAALHAQPLTRHPLAWSRTQQYRGEVLRMYAEELYAEAKDRSLGLFMQAFETLSAAREQRHRDWAPALWAETTAAMGMVFHQLGRPDRAVELYLQSLPYFNSTPNRIRVANNIVQLFSSLDSVVLYCTMAYRKDLLADIQSVLNSHDIGREDWAVTWAEIGRRLDVTPSANDLAASSARAAPRAAGQVIEQPKVAPQKWSERPTGRKVGPQRFIRDVYGAGRIARADVQTLDRPLYVALAKEIERKGLEPDLFLSDRPSQVDRELEDRGIREPADAYRQLTPDQKQDHTAIKEATRLYAAAARRTRNGSAATLSASQVAAVVEDSTLGRLQRRYAELLEKVELPPDGFQTLEQAQAAARLSSTFINLQTRRERVGLEKLPTDERVTKARQLRSLFYYHRKRDLEGPRHGRAKRAGSPGSG